MTLFPPWVYVFNPTGDLKDILVKTERTAGYYLLFADQQPQDETALAARFTSWFDSLRFRFDLIPSH